MANLYQETQVTGSRYRRAKTVNINNTKGQTPEISFEEERITVLDDGKTFSENVGVLSASFDPSGVINLLDPITGENTGTTITQAEVFQALYSFYFQLASERDNPSQEFDPMNPGM